jgi:hypothetical protein
MLNEGQTIELLVAEPFGILRRNTRWGSKVSAGVKAGRPIMPMDTLTGNQTTLRINGTVAVTGGRGYQDQLL